MVEIVEIEESQNRSDERLKDAQEIESLLSSVTRDTVKMELTALAKRMRKDAQALKRLEASKNSKEAEEEKEKSVMEDETEKKEPAVATTKSDPAPKKESSSSPTTTKAPVTLPTARYIPINSFAFDSGSYNSPLVSIYVSLEGVKKIPRDQITCDFTSTSFDLIVSDLNGKNYRLYKDNLAHDIDPSTSKVVVKVDRLIIKLGKTKGEYGYDTWTDLVDKKKKRTPGKKEDPSASIMNLMKDLYETGDDNMRKVIGETMEKQRRGELGKDSPPSFDGM